MENLYSPPATTFADAVPSDAPAAIPRWFSLSGRIGRLRWVLHSFTLICVGIVLTAVVSVSLQMLLWRTDAATMLLAFAPLLVIVEMLAILAWMSVRRLHDIGTSGWFSLLILVPAIQVLFLFGMLGWPGSVAGNAYGPPTARDSTAISVLAWLALLIVPIVIVASLSAT